MTSTTTANVNTVSRTASATAPVIDIADLEVSYGAVKAVRGISLQVQPGEIFGLLGPNGAGKTTTLSVIEGLIKPQAGRVSVLGYDMTRQAALVKRYLGISLQSTSFFDDLKLWELIKLYAALYEVFLSKAEIMKLLARFELEEKANANAKQLSGGQQQRIALVLAIANDPQIVILDEPTTGLDPQARRNIWEIVRQMQAEGRTLLLTTHYMEEAQELCQRIGIIDQGQLIALDTPTGLIKGLKADSLITVSAQLPLEKVRTLPGVTKAAYKDGKLAVSSTDPFESMLEMQRLAVEERQILADLNVKQPDLEDVFIALTGRKIR